MSLYAFFAPFGSAVSCLGASKIKLLLAVRILNTELSPVNPGCAVGRLHSNYTLVKYSTIFYG